MKFIAQSKLLGAKNPDSLFLNLFLTVLYLEENMKKT